MIQEMNWDLTAGCVFHCEALFDAQEGDDPNRAELEPLRGHSVTQQDYCLDRVQFSSVAVLARMMTLCVRVLHGVRLSVSRHLAVLEAGFFTTAAPWEHPQWAVT